jgi:hypothetical protein
VSPARSTGRERGDQTRFTRIAETQGRASLPTSPAGSIHPVTPPTCWPRSSRPPGGAWSTCRPTTGRRQPGCSGSPWGRSPTTGAARPGAMRWRTGCVPTWSTANAKRRQTADDAVAVRDALSRLASDDRELLTLVDGRPPFTPTDTWPRAPAKR